jgi:Holliday junction resolvase RusA-like endonuclease
MTYTFTIPGTLPGLNEVTQANRTHWAKGAEQKKTLTDGIAWVLRDQARSMTRQIGLADYTFTWYERNRKRDPDNIASATKYIMDSLQSAGIISNDGWRNVRSISHRFAVDKDKPRVEICIAEVGG